MERSLLLLNEGKTNTKSSRIYTVNHFFYPLPTYRDHSMSAVSPVRIRISCQEISIIIQVEDLKNKVLGTTSPCRDVKPYLQ